MYTDIASSSFRELDAVALATNVTVFTERDTFSVRYVSDYEITNEKGGSQAF